MIPIWFILYSVADSGGTFDEKLEQALFEEFQTNKLTKNHLKSVLSLDLSNRNLTSLQGIEYFTNLQELNLSGNALVDSSPLEKLQSLVTLNVGFNQFESVQFNLPKLEVLNIEENRLSSIEFVRSLESLVALNIRGNRVADLSPLEKSNQLHSLNIRGNQVKNLDVLKGKDQLMNLNARDNQLTSVEPILDLPLNERLYLEGNAIIDFQALKEKRKTIDDTDFDIPIVTPEFRTQSGVYEEPFMLELRTAKGHQIYYTLDGSMPNFHSPRYTEPIEISRDVMLEQPIYSNIKTSPLKDAFSFAPEQVKKAVTVTAVSSLENVLSEPISSTYIIEPNVFDAKLPVMTLTINPKDLFDDDGGIYVPGNMSSEEYPSWGNFNQRGRENEVRASMEYFNADGALTIKQTLGARINGSHTRIFPQKSLRLYARADYGQSYIYSKIFEELPYYKFDLLVLRGSGNDNDSTLMRDGLMHELIKGRGLDVQGYAPSIVLINGEYWGIHNIREKFNDTYIDVKYNVNKEDLTMLSFKPGHQIVFETEVGKEKDQDHFFEVINYIKEHDMTNDESIKQINTFMDIDNYLEYVAYQVYYANTDSFYNNLMMWRKNVPYTPEAPLGHDGRWRWMVYDLDWGMGYGLLERDGDPVEFNMMDYMLRDHESVMLFRELMKNQQLQLRFTEVMDELLETVFMTEHVQQKIDELAATIRPEIPRSIARWENIESVDAWEQNVKVLHDFAEKRPGIVRNHLMNAFDLSAEQVEGKSE